VVLYELSVIQCVDLQLVYMVYILSVPV